MPGKLVLVGTPLGNREDLSPRARRALLEADLLLCEDTRSPHRLLGEVALPERRSCFVGNEHERTRVLLDRLALGQTVVFVSEAGLPVWSDPGRQLVEAAVEAGYEVDVVPGPVAAACALALSGFVAEGARFVGFLPRSGAERALALQDVVHDRGASLIYEAGNRVPALVQDLAKLAPERALVIVREFTKLHQEIMRGSVTEIEGRLDEALRGEVTLVLAGADRVGEAELDQTELARRVVEIMLDPTLKPRARAKALAELTGLDDRIIYERLNG